MTVENLNVGNLILEFSIELSRDNYAFQDRFQLNELHQFKLSLFFKLSNKINDF